MANKIYKIWLLLEKNWNVADYIFGHKVRHSHAMEWSNNSYYASKTGHIFSRVRRLSSRTRQAFFKFWFYPALLSAAADLPTSGGSQKINKQQVNSSFVKARVVNGIQFKTKLTSSKTRKKKDDLMFSSLVNCAPYKIQLFIFVNLHTLWFQLQNMFQSIGKPQGIEIVMFQLKDMPQGFKKYWVKYKTWMIN